MRVFLFYTAVIGFSLGIFLHSFYAFGLPEVVWLLVMSGVVGLIRHRKSAAFAMPYLLGLSLFIFLFALGVLRVEYASWYEVNLQFENKINSKITIEGVVIREPDLRETSAHLTVDVIGEKLLVYADRYGEYEYGEKIVVTGLLKKPEEFETDLGRIFNYPGYLRARGINYVIKRATVETVDYNNGNFVVANLLSFKHSFMRSLEALLPEPEVGLSEGLLLGVKRALGSKLEAVFRETGIIHIVVLSGYNVMLVVVFITYILGVFIPPRFHLPFGLIAISAFALIVGLSATVVRATIMASLILVAKATNRTYMVIRALMLAGIIMIIINPYLLAFDTGFQLSFVATLGLILVSPHIENRLALIPSYFGIREFFTATLATQIFVTPILLYQIGQFSVVAIAVNVLVLPMVSLSMLLTFISGLLGLFSTALALPFVYFNYFSLTYILSIATWFGSLPFASFVVPAFPFWVVPVSYMVMAYILWKLHNYHSSPTAAVRGKNDVGDDVMGDWVIEEESLARKRITAESRSDSAVTDVPIFFR